jgi:hypothetical protein
MSGSRHPMRPAGRRGGAFGPGRLIAGHREGRGGRRRETVESDAAALRGTAPIMGDRRVIFDRGDAEPGGDEPVDGAFAA